MDSLQVIGILSFIVLTSADNFDPAKKKDVVFMNIQEATDIREDNEAVHIREDNEAMNIREDNEPVNIFMAESLNPGVGFDQPMHINGIFPNLAVNAESGPVRSECGIGALMPWANNLYMVSYLSVPNAGAGTGLYRIGPDFTMIKLADHNSTYANRLLHRQTSQIIIGAWIIDMYGIVRTFKQLLHVRVGATAEHLTEPESMVYMLGMDGPLWECNVTSLNCTQLYDLVKELHIPKNQQPHFKAAHTMNGRLVVASNTFDERDYVRFSHGGRLAEWMGNGTNWTILENTAFVEVTGRRNFGRVMYALGWDDRSVILKVYVGDSVTEKKARWQTYRLPKASHAYDHLWQTEWPRIREVETERYLMDMHGMFYELSPLGWGGTTFGLRPISQHLRMVPDFTSYRGFLVLGGNQVSSIMDNNVVTGQSQSGLWFGKTDDLWKFGKPQGWGSVFKRDVVTDGQFSDPFLMTGFEKKVLHLQLHNTSNKEELVYIKFDIQADFTGAAGHFEEQSWVTVKTFTLQFDSSYTKPYLYYVFDEGFSAHWVRIQMNFVASEGIEFEGYNATVTAHFMYT